MPDDELALAASSDERGRAIAGFLGGEGVPDFLAAVRVEGDGGGIRTADEANQLFAIKQRIGGKSPEWRGDVVILFEVVCPKDFSILRIEAEQVAFGAERVDLAIADERCGTRSGGITYGVRTIVFVLPKNFAVGFVETEDAFGAGDFATLKGIAGVGGILGELAIDDVHATFGDRRPRIACADGCAPTNGGTFGRKFFNDALFAPDGIAFGAEPLRPIIGKERCGNQ